MAFLARLRQRLPLGRTRNNNDGDGDGDGDAGGNAQQQPSGSAAEEPPVCRICLCGDETAPLISPCKCRGTNAKVHLACLNTWRRASANARSLRECLTCGHVYDTRKSQLALMLDSQWAVPVATGVAIGAAAHVVAIIAAIVCGSIGNAATRIYHAMYLYPPWRNWTWAWAVRLAAALDTAVVATVLLGVIGFAHAIYIKYQQHPQHFLRYSAVPLVMLANSHGGAAVRIFSAIGLWVGYHSAFKCTRSLASYALMRWGETILEVHD